MIAGGYISNDTSGLRTEVVELFNTNSTPSFGELPNQEIGAVGAMFSNAPIICSGWYHSGMISHALPDIKSE